MAPPCDFYQVSDNNNPHFFKVVLHHVLQEQKLEIPTKFVKKHGQTAFLNNKTCLEVADGREWNVDVTKSNGRVWFHDHGWQNFVEFYSVGFEYFLVFRYEMQSSSFRVVIFDLTATEIEYPTKRNCVRGVVENIELETSLDDHDLPSHSQGGEASTSSQRRTAIARATTYQSTTLNPSFMSKMSPSRINPAKALGLPTRFAKMHLKETIETVLEVSDGRRWSLRCVVYRCRNKQIKAELRKGWMEFAHDNKLRVEDVCVFEIIRKTPKKIIFKVEIFRN